MAPPRASAAGRWWPAWLAAWGLIALLQLAVGLAGIRAGTFPDPDDALRLQEVRDLLAGQSWFDVTQYRVDPLGGGVAMHWSRLVDLPIATVIVLLRPLFGMAAAERAAMVVVPLLTLGLALALVARLVVVTGGAARRRAGDVDPVFLAGVVLAMAAPVVAQIRPMRIDHHGWQIVAALAALNGLMARDARGGWLAGAAMALGLAVSIEGLPLAVAVAGIGALRWLRDGGPRPGAWLAAYLGGLALAGIAAFLATRGLDSGEHCDAIAPVHLAVFALAAAGVAAMAAARLRGRAVLAGLALLGGAALALVLALAPVCTRGTFPMLDPVVRTLWLDRIDEGLPLWAQNPTPNRTGALMATIVPMLAGLAAAAALAWRSAEPATRRLWRDYALATAAAVAVGGMVARAGGAACAFAAVPLARAIARWLAVARGPGAWPRRLAAAAAVVLVLAPALPFARLPGWRHAATAPGPAAGVARPGDSDGMRVADCAIADNASALVGQGRHLLAPLDLGPDLLLATSATVLATSHHRGAGAMRATIDAFTAPLPAARAIVRAERIDTVVLCPGLAEPGLYAAVAPQGLAARLLAGRPPAWLAPLPPAGHLRGWRVIG